MLFCATRSAVLSQSVTGLSVVFDLNNIVNLAIVGEISVALPNVILPWEILGALDSELVFPMLVRHHMHLVWIDSV